MRIPYVKSVFNGRNLIMSHHHQTTHPFLSHAESALDVCYLYSLSVILTNERATFNTISTIETYVFII